MNSGIDIKKIDITELEVDVIVNAANSQLREGGGVCGAIFRKAGSDELGEACSRIGSCKTGGAVITPGFNLPARYIIHAVGPIYHGGDSGEAELLYSAYEKSLILAKENDCHSIAFPVISSGIYGYPKKEAWQIAVRACSDFLRENEDYQLNIVFAVLGDDSRRLGVEVIREYDSFN